MVHIHYEEGPKILSDVSFEKSMQITKLLTESYSNRELAIEFEVSEDVVKEIRDIAYNGLRRCCFCGSLFKSNAPRRITCYKKEHFLPCIDCGVPVKVKESYAMYQKSGGRRCEKCRGRQIGNTRRGKNQEEKKEIIAKQQATMIERYGAATPLQVPEMKAKIQATIKEKYGVDNLSQSAEIQEKIREHSQEKYGVDHYTNAPEIRQRMIQGMIEKYGVEHAQQNEEIHERTKQTNLKRYGVENVFQNEEVRKTFMEKHREKYQVSWPNQRREHLTDPSKFDDFLVFSANPEEYILTRYKTKPSVQQLCQDVGLDETTVYDKLIKLGIRDLATENEYSMETELIEFLLQMNNRLNIIKHERKLLLGREIDIYLPDLKIGFECNPTCTHNSSFDDPWGNPPKNYKYHAEKSILARDKGVFIYHIFGYEWAHRKDQIKSQIANLLGQNNRKIYARKTIIRSVSFHEACHFLDANHRQGSAQSKVRLGLYTADNELVSLMTFGKMRLGIGKKSDQSDNEWELIRFCNLINTSVVGSASKLFKHFIDNYSPKKVVSFSDIAHTKGTLYQTLGFEEKSVSDPGYVWVKLLDDSYLSRVSCQKQNLIHMFKDVTEEDIKIKTEPEIMMEHGYARVFDSGVIRWEYTC